MSGPGHASHATVHWAGEALRLKAGEGRVIADPSAAEG